jgi:hypothetical protein
LLPSGLTRGPTGCSGLKAEQGNNWIRRSHCFKTSFNALSRYPPSTDVLSCFLLWEEVEENLLPLREKVAKTLFKPRAG